MTVLDFGRSCIKIGTNGNDDRTCRVAPLATLNKVTGLTQTQNVKSKRSTTIGAQTIERIHVPLEHQLSSTLHRT